MYSFASDHNTKDYPTLLGKIWEKRNHNNQNAQWISTEARENGININIVMRGGAKTRPDVVRQDPSQHQWVKKNVEPHKLFDAQNEKETFKKYIQELLNPDIASTSNT
jgi:hypothetical protein